MEQPRPPSGSPGSTRCPICLCTEVEPGVTVNPYHPVFQCKLCTHAFVAPDSLNEEQNRAVQLDHFGEGFASRQGFFVTLYEQLNVRRTIKALKLRRPSRVLEAGPGSGLLMAWLSEHGHTVTGIDLSPAIARRIRQRWGLNVTLGSLDTDLLAGTEQSYDAIVMRHVVEHLGNPVFSLKAAHAALKPGGLLYVAVPNIDSWHRRFRGWSGYEPYHVHYFGRASLYYALRTAGFQIVEIASYESASGWPNTLIRSLLATRGPATVSSVPISKQGWKRSILEILRLIVGSALYPVRWVQAALGRGEELTALCIRPLA